MFGNAVFGNAVFGNELFHDQQTILNSSTLSRLQVQQIVASSSSAHRRTLKFIPSSHPQKIRPTRSPPPQWTKLTASLRGPDSADCVAEIQFADCVANKESRNFILGADSPVVTTIIYQYMVVA